MEALSVNDFGMKPLTIKFEGQSGNGDGRDYCISWTVGAVQGARCKVSEAGDELVIPSGSCVARGAGSAGGPGGTCPTAQDKSASGSGGGGVKARGESLLESFEKCCGFKCGHTIPAVGTAAVKSERKEDQDKRIKVLDQSMDAVAVQYLVGWLLEDQTIIAEWQVESRSKVAMGKHSRDRLGASSLSGASQEPKLATSRIDVRIEGLSGASQEPHPAPFPMVHNGS